MQEVIFLLITVLIFMVGCAVAIAYFPAVAAVLT
jgi:hypothetical protein